MTDQEAASRAPIIASVNPPVLTSTNQRSNVVVPALAPARRTQAPPRV
jgi:hypothetical protein